MTLEDYEIQIFKDQLLDLDTQRLIAKATADQKGQEMDRWMKQVTKLDGLIEVTRKVINSAEETHE